MRISAGPVLLAFLVVFSAASVSSADALAEKKEELNKVRNYIRLLDEKMEAARAARQINRVAQLNELKRRQVARGEMLNKQIAGLEKTEKVKEPEPKAAAAPAQAPEKKPKKGLGGWRAELGYGGGALLAGGAYGFPFQNLDLEADAGYGVGNGYSIIAAGLRAVFPVGENIAGAEVGVANYSEPVSGILGVSGSVDGGSKPGFGVFVTRPIWNFIGRAAYNTALGITLSAVYRF